MEKWEVAHITKHLATLIKTTRCSAVLKAGLKAMELLNDEEDQRLTALGRSEGSICEAKLLYEIMITRSKGYNGLIEVLLDDRQDGALKILLEGLQQPESEVASADSIAQLSNMRVQLANCTKRFHEVFLKFTREDEKDLLQNGELKQELEAIFRNGSLEIKLHGDLPVPSDLYIPRLLSNRLQLDPQVFTLHSCPDVFVFTNISRIELAQLIKPHAVWSSINQRIQVTGRHIYLDDDEDWDDMVAISEFPIHLVSKEEGGYILQRTSKVTDVLQKYVSREGRSKEAFVTEDAFVENIVSDNNPKGALICDVAGMGKTWLMQSLAAKMRNKTADFVVFFIEFTSFSKFLSGSNLKPSDKEALASVLNFACQSKLASHLLHKYAEQNRLKIAFVLDGYDEINKDDIEVVNSYLEVFCKFAHIKLLISSRPNMREFLQETFNLISYDILPFQTEQQVHCIVNQWANVCPRLDTELCKLKEFALECIKSVKSIQKDTIHDIMGEPLKCRILATVNEKRVKQLCKADRRRPIQVFEAVTIKSVFDLYTCFVDALVDKEAQKNPPNSRKNFVNGIFTFYTQMALELLLPDLSIVYLQYYEVDSSMEEQFSCVGVARVNNVKQRLEFVHRSFAEFFVGRFFAEFWNDIEQYSPSFGQRVGSYFIEKVLAAFDVPSNVKWALDNISYWHDDLSDLCDEKKTFQLKYPLILMFMNQKLNKLQFDRSACEFRNVTASYGTEAIITTNNVHHVGSNTIKQEYDPVGELKIWLAETSFKTMMACIEERLINIFSLYVRILTSFFDLEDRVALILPAATVFHKNESSAYAVWLLCRVAQSKSLENAVELFNLFGNSQENYLSRLCQHFPQEYWSPLEVAILTEDIDMIHYFVDKVILPVGRLFITCVTCAEGLPSSKIDVKVEIMKLVLGSSERVMDLLCTANLYSDENLAKMSYDFSKSSFQLLVKFVETSKRSINSISSENKRFFLQHCFIECNDEETINLLLTLYGKSDDTKRSIPNLVQNQTYTADEVLDALDIVEARDAFSKVKLKSFAFHNCSKLETLKVLTAIQPDFSSCNQDKWNYLHVAAFKQNIDWVKYLIISGSEVDQLDELGNTPLLCASTTGTNNPKSLLAVTRLLIENRANVYAKDWKGSNIAHKVFSNCWNAESKDLCEWVSYMLDNGYYQLWEMRDDDGQTPQEILIRYAGKNSPMTTDILRLFEKYSVVSTKQS